MKIRFWKDKAEFEAHAANHKPIGWETVPEEKPARQPYRPQSPALIKESRTSTRTNKQKMEVASKGKLLKLQNAAEPDANIHRVYILKSADGNDDVYVGQSPISRQPTQKAQPAN